MVATATGLLGLIVGSFVNVVAYRVPEGRSVIRPRSACPTCGAAIRPRDNVPVLSWFLLRGRCRDCSAPISVRYPIVEAITAALFVATPFVLGVAWVLPAYLWFVGVSVTLVLTDLDHQRIPNRILFPGLVIGLILLSIGSALDGDLAQLGRGATGGALYFGLLFVIALIARGGLGFGDVKLAALLGLFTAYQSWKVLVTAIALAILIGGVIAAVLLAARLRGRKDAIPFGPSLVAGALAALAVGERLADWYLSV